MFALHTPERLEFTPKLITLGFIALGIVLRMWKVILGHIDNAEYFKAPNALGSEVANLPHAHRPP